MIDPHLYAAFVTAVVVLMLVPGPNVALIVANSLAHGPRYGLLTVAGTTTAMAAQLGVVALGMAGLLDALGLWFSWLRWVGVAYLVGLGIAHWRAPITALTASPQPRSGQTVFARGVLVSLTNPKTLLFYGAFLPQFVDLRGNVGGQLALLSITFLALAVMVDGGWAVLAGRARPLLAARGRLRNRLTGGLLIGAGAGLALARRR